MALLCCLASVALWAALCLYLSDPDLIIGALSAFTCAGACSTSVPEDLTLEGSQESWDKDIPAINQGEGTVSSFWWRRTLSCDVKTTLNTWTCRKG
jgi:hypothetical protein